MKLVGIQKGSFTDQSGTVRNYARAHFTEESKDTVGVKCSIEKLSQSVVAEAETFIGAEVLCYFNKYKQITKIDLV